jgi:hypothetical protein
VKHWLRQNANSDSHLLNCYLARFAVDSARRPNWIFGDGVATRLRPIPVPATVTRHIRLATEAYSWKGRRATVLEPIGGGDGQIIDIALAILPPDRIVALPRPIFAVVPLWTTLERVHAQDAWPRPVCAFPPAWSRLCGVAFPSQPSVFAYAFYDNNPVARLAEHIPTVEIDRLKRQEPTSLGDVAHLFQPTVFEYAFNLMATTRSYGRPNSFPPRKSIH